MIPAFDDILRKQDLSLEEIKVLLAAEGDEKERLLRRGLAVKLQHLDNYVHLRGLIEFGNVCEKNCFYCGLRSGNDRVERYCLSDEEVLDCARLAHELGYGSVALQSGERSDPAFIERIERLVRKYWPVWMALAVAQLILTGYLTYIHPDWLIFADLG